jgi:hypothetical protein
MKMKYEKPEVVVLMEASKAIQGGIDKGLPLLQDGNPPFDNTATETAYQADE